MRIAVQVAPQHLSYDEIRSAVTRLEDMGVDVIFNWDHFFPISGEPDGRHYESWTMLAAVAEQTSRVEFGPLVNCNSYRNPDLQADMARTIDHISGGRFIFGTGAGWAERDYREYEYEFPSVGARLDTLAIDIPRIRARWDKLNPRPTRPIPILIGGEGEQKTLRIVAEHANIWHSLSPPEMLARKIAVLDRWCARIGRNPDEIELSAIVPGGSDGSTLAKLHALGVSLIQLTISGPELYFEPVAALVAWRDSLR